MVLSKSWKHQITSSKVLRKVGGEYKLKLNTDVVLISIIYCGGFFKSLFQNVQFLFLELAPVLRQCQEVTAEMLHFVRQTQYYFLFEVLECAWKQMKEDVQLAASLDGVIEAHTEFLEKVTAGVFMDEAHKVNHLI